MKYILFISLLLFSVFAISGKVGAFADPVNTGVQGKIFEAKQLRVELSRINDVGFLIVIDQSGKATIVASAEQTLGITGSVTVDLEPYLQESSNLLVFALWNREGRNLDLRYWQKTFLTGYSYRYSLIADGTTLYRLEGDKRGKAGISYWNAFFISKDDDGLTIKPISKGAQAQFEQIFEAVSNNTTLTSINQKAVNLGANIATALMRGL